MITIHSIKELRFDPKQLDMAISILEIEAPDRTETARKILNKYMMRAENGRTN